MLLKMNRQKPVVVLNGDNYCLRSTVFTRTKNSISICIKSYHPNWYNQVVLIKGTEFIGHAKHRAGAKF